MKIQRNKQHHMKHIVHIVYFINNKKKMLLDKQQIRDTANKHDKN